MAKQYDSLRRILLVGDTGVGKTCLICQYACKEFYPNHITTIGVDFKMKTIDVDGKIVKLQMWDTAGQERFEAITKQFYTRAQGCVLVYDIGDRSSFESLAKWLLYVKQYTKKNTALIMIGNKCDMEERRKVPSAVAQQFADENGILFYETSAKTSTNINKPFEDLCRMIVRQDEMEPDEDIEKRLSVTVDLRQDSDQSLSDSLGEHSFSTKNKGWNCC